LRARESTGPARASRCRPRIAPATRPAKVPAHAGLTSRELRLRRRSRPGAPQIGAELFISPKTASVHVTSILRKLGVTGRVQAAAAAERAGLLGDEQA
jgi:DNA-binding NarL/FixJ family response regulator